MIKLLFACLISSLFLLTSCEKEALTPITTEDYRDHLVGTYKGTIAYEDAAESSQSKESVIARDHLLDQNIEITKSDMHQDALIINGNVLNLVTQSNSNKNQYSDVFLYSAEDCSGKEAYTLTFLPAENRLILEYEHDRACSIGVLKQNSIFEGLKK